MKKISVLIFSLALFLFLSLVSADLTYPVLEFTGDLVCVPEENVVKFSMTNQGDAGIFTDNISIIVHLYMGEEDLGKLDITGEWNKEFIDINETSEFTSLGGQFVLRGDYTLQVEHIMLPNNYGYRIVTGHISCESISSFISHPEGDNSGGEEGVGVTGGEEDSETCSEGEEKECESIFTDELVKRTGCKPVYRCENGKWSDICYTVKDCPEYKKDTTPIRQYQFSEEKTNKTYLILFIAIGVAIIIVGFILFREIKKRK